MRFHFEPRTSLIVFIVELEHLRKDTTRMALDTGASFTIITPQVARRLGFNLDALTPEETICTASQYIKAYKLVISIIRFYKETIYNLEVRCFPLPTGLRVDGLLGLNFLRNFKVTLDFGEGLASFERLASRSEAGAQP